MSSIEVDRSVHHTMKNAAKIEREKIINSLFNAYFPAQSLIQYSNAKFSSQKVAEKCTFVIRNQKVVLEVFMNE